MEITRINMQGPTDHGECAICRCCHIYDWGDDRGPMCAGVIQDYDHHDLLAGVDLEEVRRQVEGGRILPRERVVDLLEMLRRQELLLNTPEIHDFTRAVQLEAAHQRARWGSEHDAGKKPEDWFWLIGYLAGKALREDGIEKRLHRIIATAAALANWHTAVLGKTNMRPGIATPAGEEG